MNVTLSGLEDAIKANFKRQDKINVVIYADDFIITGATKEVLENRAKPIVEWFLKERGLELSQEKTKITHINEGFDFLGVNMRKYRNGKRIQKPTKEGIKRFLKTLKETIHKNQAVSTEILIHLLNPKLTGWANYYRHYCSKKTFGTVSHRLFSLLWTWAKKRHNRKEKLWIVKKYFRTKGNNNWQFSTRITNKKGKPEWLDLVEIKHTPIRRHVKIKGDATPFDPAYDEYFCIRQARRKAKRLFFPCKSQWSPWCFTTLITSDSSYC